MSLLAEIALIVVAAAGVAASLALLPAPVGSRKHRALLETPTRPEQLARLERLVRLSSANALHVHADLRPRLAEIASRRIAARGQTLERMSDPEGRAVLGDQLWEIVRPGRRFPEDRYGPGVSVGDLAAMLEVLERL